MAPIEQLTVVDDRYEIVGILDSGGTGVVYRAVDRRLGRTVAIKVVHTTEPGLAERAAREAKLLARLDHPNVVRVYDAGVHAGSPYVVTELVPGRPLSRLAARGPMRAAEIAVVGHDAAAGLAATHRAGIVHRDLKPANILVSDQGVVKLLDYGVATVADLETVSLDGEMVGTPRYLAPEQVQGGEIGPPVDVYALGLVLIECLAGRHPFGGTVGESVGARITQDPSLPPGLAPRWTELLSAMTERDPSARPTAEEVADKLAPLSGSADLRQLVASGDDTVVLQEGAPMGEPPTVVMAVPAEPSPPHRRRRWWVAVAAFVVLVAAASAAGAWRLADQGPTGAGPSTTVTTAPPPSTVSTSLPPATSARPTTTTTRPPETTTTTKARGGKGKGGKPHG